MKGGLKGAKTQTRRNHQTKEKDTTRNRSARVFTRRRVMEGGGFCEENTRDKKKAREQNASTNTKRTESHTFKGASRKPQRKDCKLKQDASTKQKKKTRHEIDLRGFSHEAAVWKVLRRKENESKLKWKKNKLKQNAITNQRIVVDKKDIYAPVEAHMWLYRWSAETCVRL